MTWGPAIDVYKLILGGQIVAVVALLTIRAIVKVRAKSNVKGPASGPSEPPG
jgi:hypothetical protein